MAGATMIWGLGMSETLGPYSYGDELRAPGYPLCAPMDHFADGFEVRVADARGPAGAATGEVGEIQVRGYAVTPGLHKMRARRIFTADGFYHTGDMGLFQGSRLLFIGRGGDMIKTAGSNVSPAEVEMEMQQLDGVQSAYVVGLPDTERGQLVAAAVVPGDDSARFRRRRGEAEAAAVHLQGAARLCRRSAARTCRCCTATRSLAARSSRCYRSGASNKGRRLPIRPFDRQ